MCLVAFLLLLNFPPSEKLSGVRFKTPSIFGIFLNSKLEKFFFLVLIFFKSKLTFFFKSLVKYFIWLIEIFFFYFLVIISIWSNDISLIWCNGMAFFLLTKIFDWLP